MRTGLLALIAVLVASSGAHAGTLDEPSTGVLRTMALLDLDPAPAPKGWDPHAVRALVTDKVVGFLPDGIIEDVARSFADQTLTLEVGPNRAFVRLKLSL